MPARLLGGIIVVLALMTLVQDAGGALATALAGGPPANPAARPVWIADLALDAPAVLVGVVLLWRRHPLGYAASAGLSQYGLTPVGLVASMALGAVLAGQPLDAATSGALLVFGLVCFVALVLFLRGPGPAKMPAGAGMRDQQRDRG